MNRVPTVACVILTALLVVVTWLWADARASLARERSRTQVAQFIGDVERGSAAGRIDFPDTPAPPETRAATRPAAVTPGTLVPDAATASSSADQIGLLLVGRVSDEKGQAVEGASVVLQSEEIEYRKGSVATTGTYVVTDLHPGVWRVMARARARAPFEADITLAAAPARMRYDIVLPRATIIPVRFQTRDGKSLNAMLPKALPTWSRRWKLMAIATLTDPGAHLARTESSGHTLHALGVWHEATRSSNAKVNLPEECDGYVEVYREPPFLITAVVRDEVLAIKQVTSSTDEVVFTLEVADFQRALAGARVRVVDALTGAPVAGATVELNDLQESGGGRTTGADGVMLFENHFSGLGILAVHAANYEELAQYVRLPADRVTDLGDIRIAPATTISGVLRAPDGAPIAGVITCCNLDRVAFAQPLHLPGSDAPAGADGRFRIQGVGRGRHLLVGKHDPHALTTVAVDTSGGDVADVELRLSAGTRVVLDLTEAAVEHLLQIKDAAGVLQYSGRYPRAGRVSLQLAAGSYVLTVYDDDAPMLTKPFEVGATPVTVRVAP